MNQHPFFWSSLGAVEAPPPPSSVYLGFTDAGEFDFTGFSDQVIDVSLRLWCQWGVSQIGGTGGRTSSASLDVSVLGGTGLGSVSGTCTGENCGGQDVDYISLSGLTKESSLNMWDYLGNCEVSWEYDVRGETNMVIYAINKTSGIGTVDLSTGNNWQHYKGGSCEDLYAVGYAAPPNLTVTQVSTKTSYYTSSAIDISTRIYNSGGLEGQETMQWKIVDGLDVTQSSGTTSSGIINGANGANVISSSITPSTPGTYYAKCKMGSDSTWVTGPAFSVTALTTVSVTWMIAGGALGHLVVTDEAEAITYLDQRLSSGSGGFTVPMSELPYLVTASCESGSGNIVRCRICNSNDGGEIWTSPDLGIGDSSSHLVDPTPTNVYIQMRTAGTALVTCPIP
jgi:hypothetical protein